MELNIVEMEHTLRNKNIRFTNEAEIKIQKRKDAIKHLEEAKTKEAKLNEYETIIMSILSLISLIFTIVFLILVSPFILFLFPVFIVISIYLCKLIMLRFVKPVKDELDRYNSWLEECDKYLEKYFLTLMEFCIVSVESNNSIFYFVYTDDLKHLKVGARVSSLIKYFNGHEGKVVAFDFYKESVSPISIKEANKLNAVYLSSYISDVSPNYNDNFVTSKYNDRNNVVNQIDKDKKYVYVRVQFDNDTYNRSYYYICDDWRVKVGDRVKIPSLNNKEAIVMFRKVYNENEVPYPISNTKKASLISIYKEYVDPDDLRIIKKEKSKYNDYDSGFENECFEEYSPWDDVPTVVYDDNGDIERYD